MEKTKITLNQEIASKLNTELEKSLQNPTFCSLVKRVKITKEEARNFNSSLMDTVEELEHCKNCKGLSHCQNRYQGHVLYPNKTEGNLTFAYTPCRYQNEYVKKLNAKEDSLNELKHARMKDINTDDQKRIPIIKWLKNFYDKYEKVNTLKGLYLHGPFGVGKTYLIAALLNELKIKKDAEIEIIYLQEMLRSLKEDFSDLENRIRYYQTVDILFIDDIGAEKVTTWGRDEILGTILQYRMNHKLTTFFTSNLTINELEDHLSITSDSEDRVKARRIIERIKCLTDDLELISESRR